MWMTEKQVVGFGNRTYRDVVAARRWLCSGNATVWLTRRRRRVKIGLTIIRAFDCLPRAYCTRQFDERRRLPVAYSGAAAKVRLGRESATPREKCN